MQPLSAEPTLQNSLIRVLSRKRLRVSHGIYLCWVFFVSERWAGSSFKPSKRNGYGGEGLVKKERSTGVGDNQRMFSSGIRCSTIHALDVRNHEPEFSHRPDFQGERC